MYSKKFQVSRELLESGLVQLKHRGPDGKNTWLSKSHHVGLGHARLSIMDLEGGSQPISDGSSQIVVNGEFYDDERIRDSLRVKGYSFKTSSDSEILLHLYRELGADCLSQLRGEFAFVLWDDQNQTLFAARDRFGIKPLYYSLYGETLTLASEVKALFAMGVPRRWDEEVQYQLHTSFMMPPHRTCFEGVYQVPPGHYILATTGSFRVIPYWDFEYPKLSQVSQLGLFESIEQLRSLLIDSVRLRLRADVPIACYLSGGLDSSALLGMASSLISSPIHTFTLSFDQVEYDEARQASETARFRGARSHLISITQKDLAAHFSEAVWHAETALINTHAVAKFLLSKSVRDAGFKVVLTGEGADEIFGGYDCFVRDRIQQYGLDQTNGSIQDILNNLYENSAVSQPFLYTDPTLAPIQSVQNSLGFVPTFFQNAASAQKAFHPLMDSGFLKKFESNDPFRALLNEIDVRRQLRDRDPVHQSMYLWSKTHLPQYNLSVLGDRMEMSHSVEGRLPFLDPVLVEWVVKQSIDSKIRFKPGIEGFTEKYLLREAAKPFLTETIYQRKKHQFLAPPATSFQMGPLFELIQDTLRSRVLAQIPFYQQDQVIELLDQLKTCSPSLQVAYDPILMKIMSHCFLQERFQLG